MISPDLLSPELLGAIMLVCLLGTIFLGFPVSFTLLLLAVVFGYAGFGKQVFYLMVLQTYKIMSDETMAAVPLFVFMGHLMESAGLMERLFKSFQLMFARMKGSLYVGVLASCTIFAAATGIIGAATTVIGIMAAPSMRESKYSPSLSAGAITAGGCLGILIPPSVMLILMGPVLGISVVALFMAAVIPGVILSTLFIMYAVIRCQINPSLGPPLPKEMWPESKWAVIKEFLFGVVPLGFVVFAALGTILVGIATPTEAAAMGSSGAIILCLLYRRLTLAVLRESCIKALRTTSMIVLLVVTSTIYGSTFIKLGTGSVLANAMLGLDLPPLAIMAVLMATIFLLGWPLEWAPILFIFVPIFLPVVTKLNFDLVWFGTLLAVNLQTAFLSPPVAMSAYYLKAVAPDWTIGEIYNGMLQFMALQFVGLGIVFFFPQTAIWLPNLLYGG